MSKKEHKEDPQARTSQRPGKSALFRGSGQIQSVSSRNSSRQRSFIAVLNT